MENKINASTAESEGAVRWTPLTSLLGVFVAYIASQVVLIVPTLLIMISYKTKEIQKVLDSSPWLSLVLTGISSLGMLVVLWLFLKVKKANVKDLGFKKIMKTDWLWLALSIVFYFVFLIVALMLATLIPGFNGDQAQSIGYKNATGWQLSLAFMGLVIVPPLVEEMLFRGYLYRGLKSKWPKIVAALVSSLLFALVHFQWNVGVDVFVLSLVLVFLYEKTKNLWMCVGLHTLKNFLAFLVIFVFSAH